MFENQKDFLNHFEKNDYELKKIPKNDKQVLFQFKEVDNLKENIHYLTDFGHQMDLNPSIEIVFNDIRSDNSTSIIDVKPSICFGFALLKNVLVYKHTSVGKSIYFSLENGNNISFNNYGNTSLVDSKAKSFRFLIETIFQEHTIQCFADDKLLTTVKVKEKIIPFFRFYEAFQCNVQISTPLKRKHTLLNELYDNDFIQLPVVDDKELLNVSFKKIAKEDINVCFNDAIKKRIVNEENDKWTIFLQNYQKSNQLYQKLKKEKDKIKSQINEDDNSDQICDRILISLLNNTDFEFK